MTQAAPPPLPKSFWRRPIGWLTIGLIAFITLLVMAFAGLGIAINAGYIPDTKAVAGKDLPPALLERLRAEGIIEPDEEVLYFYSDDLLSILADGNLFTDRRVISYGQWEDPEVQSFSATYPEILAIEPRWSNSLFENSVLTVHTETHEFELWVANESKGDRKFYEKLIKTWEARRLR